MSSPARKHGDSRLSVRLALFMGLFWTGLAEGLLSPDSLRTSSLALSYAFGLGAMGLSIFTFMLREGWSYLRPEAPEPAAALQTGPVWHRARFFTDPAYQIPAIYCVLVLIVRLTLDLRAGPPLSERAWWFLVFMAFAAVAVPVIFKQARTRIRARARGIPDGRIQADEMQDTVVADGSGRGEEGAAVLESTDRKDGSTDRHESGKTFAPGFRDPWFTVPALALGTVHVIRNGMESIQEDPSSFEATAWFFAPLLAVALAAAISSIARLRRRRKEALNAAGNQPMTVTDAAH